MFASASIILAGGRSRRMGKDKALLRRPGAEGITFVEYLATLLTALSSEVLLVTRDASHAASYTLPGVQTVIDKVPDIGPLMGLYSGLSAIHSSHALVVAVDMPFVQPDVAAFLLSQPLHEAVLVPVVENVPQVLLALYPRTLLPAIEERLRAGRRDLRGLLEVTPVHYIAEAQLRELDPQLRSFVNLNTPQDLASQDDG